MIKGNQANGRDGDLIAVMENAPGYKERLRESLLNLMANQSSVYCYSDLAGTTIRKELSEKEMKKWIKEVREEAAERKGSNEIS